MDIGPIGTVPRRRLFSTQGTHHGHQQRQQGTSQPLQHRESGADQHAQDSAAFEQMFPRPPQEELRRVTRSQKRAAEAEKQRARKGPPQPEQ